ncbi:hypothetical protein [Sabulicella glaciei]|uniref:Uncharacterized protein n=1 Tax=Sabulicella glaciei TaxID=2984948 RepID=A0ABT3P373_9PROT|nr:hypothetical protein [Roseococcus sp. MDT2-1-1]MCW8088224.1 hypothetical protein [Roseococcus sp. MDT2-1-1]
METEESRRGILRGAAVEAARRLAAEAGVEPPSLPEDHYRGVDQLADRILAVFLMQKAPMFHAGAAWGSDIGAGRLEQAAAHLMLRDPLFQPSAEWVGLHAEWQRVWSVNSESYILNLDTGTVTPERHEGGRI